MSIKERLRMVIEAQNVSIKAFAESVDTPLRTVHNYLSGEREPSSEFLSRVAGKFNINVNWLLLDKGEMHIIDDMHLTADEFELLTQYRAINEVGRLVLKNVSQIMFNELKSA